MIRTIQNIAVTIFIISVILLTLLAVLAIWDVFDEEVLWKSLSTIGVLSFASLVTILATRAIDKHNSNGSGNPPSGGASGMSQM